MSHLTSIALCLALLQQILAIAALNNGLATRPPMGWSARVRFACEQDCTMDDCTSNSSVVKRVAEKLRVDGFREIGYNHLLLEDCWAKKERDLTTGRLLSDEQRFPGGLAELTQHLHQIMFKLGVTGNCAQLTPNGYPGQLKPGSPDHLADNYFNQDAETLLNEWELDSFGFDAQAAGSESLQQIDQVCSAPMASALDQARPDRPTLVQCKWPARLADPVNMSLVAESCNTWRLFPDSEDSWLSVLRTVDLVTEHQAAIADQHGPGHWFDPGELVIGNYGLSSEQERAQMALWCMWSAPLVMGNDPRSLDTDAVQVLKSHNLIELDQDPLGVLGLKVAESADGLEQAFVKPVAELSPNGCPSFVVLYLNRNVLGNKRLVTFNLREMLTQVPLDLAAERYATEMRATKAIGSEQVTHEGQVLDAKSCDRLLRNAMTSPRVAIPADLLVSPGGARQPVEPLAQVQVNYQVTDLLANGRQPEKQVGLDSDLSLSVAPSGVAVVKLREI